MLRKLILTYFILGLTIISFAEIKIIGRAPEIEQGPEVEISSPVLTQHNKWFGIEDDSYSIQSNTLALPCTLRLCVLRVQFAEDNNTRSTGSGQFDLTPQEESPYPIDPTPHNRQYFDSHMQAVSRYWAMVSDSNIVIEYLIWPLEWDNPGYTLPDSMAYYGPNDWYGDNLGARMEGFIKDALLLAQDTDGIDYTRYDDIVIFHSGADMQNDIASNYDPDVLEYYPYMLPSPDDLPSGYKVIFDDFLPGVKGALIMPEASSQDGQIVAINGTMAHEVGHLLGLVDLYSTYNFASMVGNFSLMDNGHMLGVQLVLDPNSDEVYNVYGAIPTYPCAWDRAFLGIEDVVIADKDSVFNIQACELVDTGTTIVKIPINDYEYFLVENRHVNPDGETISLKADEETGVILGLIDDSSEFVSKYDFLLPGSGILIWHIDELVAYGDYYGNGYNNFENNALQWDYTNLFVDIEEAAGFQDIGYYVHYGDSLDYFFAPNKTEFTPFTRPSSDSKDGAHTSIFITEISEPGEYMSFRFSRELSDDISTWHRRTGFPLIESPVVSDIDFNGESEIFAVTGNYLLAWNLDGSRIIDNSETLGLIDFSGDTTQLPFNLFAVLDSSYSSNISISNIDGDDFEDILIADQSSKLYAYHCFDYDDNGRADLHEGYPVTFDTPISTRIYCYNTVCFGCENGDFYRLVDDDYDLFDNYGGKVVDFYINENQIPEFLVAENELGKLFINDSIDGSTITSVLLDTGNIEGLAVSYLDNDRLPDVVITSSDGYVFAYNNYGEALDGFPVIFDVDYLSAPALGDIDNDGKVEIILSADEKIIALNHTGILVENFPVELYGLDVAFYGEPSIADIDGDNEQEIVLTNLNGNIFAIEKNGMLCDNYPIESGNASSQPFIADMNSDEDLEMVVASQNGSLMLFNFDSESSEIHWTYDCDYERHILLHDGDLPYSFGKEIVNPYAWPNPCGENVNIRFGLGSDAGSTGKIYFYSQDGTNVLETDFETKPGDINEVAISTFGIPSGVYHARIIIDDNKDTAKFIKVAIVK